MTKHYIFGIHAVEALLNKNAHRVIRLCVQQDRHDEKMNAITQQAMKNAIKCEMVSRAELDKMTDMANHQGVIAFVEKAETYSEADIPGLIQHAKATPFILILDNVQDPHNLGACFRSADAAGVDFIIAPKDKAVGITPIVSKVASGAIETTPFVQVTNLARTLEQLKDLGVWIYGMAGEAAQSIYDIDLTGPVALVLGAEGEGLRRLTRERCDALVKIPMRGSVDSLNVSVATGISLFEALRQRLSQ